jgi:tetratricopeptide (TPR) repeat protein
MAEIARYLKKIRSLYEAGTRDASAYRQPLKALIASTAEGVTTAPVRTLAGFSSADLVVLVDGQPTGHILYEEITTDLDEVEEGWQGEAGPPEGDLLVTNFIEFRHYRDGTLVRSARLAQARRLFKPDRRGEGRVDRLLQHFVGKRTRRLAPLVQDSPTQTPDDPDGVRGGKGEQGQTVEEFQFFDSLFDEEQDNLPYDEPPPDAAPAEDGGEPDTQKRGFFRRLFARREKPESQEDEAPPEEFEPAAPIAQDDDLEGTLLDLNLTTPTIPETQDTAPPPDAAAQDIPSLREATLPDMAPAEAKLSDAPPVDAPPTDSTSTDVPSPTREAAAPPVQVEPPPIEQPPAGDKVDTPQPRHAHPGDRPWWLETGALKASPGDGPPESTSAPAPETPTRLARTGPGSLPISPGLLGDETPLASLQAQLFEAQDQGDPREIAGLLSRIGHDLYARGETSEAINHYWQALVHFRELGDRRSEAAVLACLGRIYATTGEREYALSQFVDALPILEEIDDPFLEGFIQGHMGVVHYEMGIYEAAAANLTDALPRVTSDETLYGLFIGKLGEVSYRLGNPERAASLLEEALLYRVEHEAQHARFLSTLGAARYRQGQYRAAAGSLKDAIHATQQLGDHAQEGKLWGRLGAALHMTGDYEKADDAHRKALAIHSSLGDTKGEATALYNLAGTYEARQQYEKAANLFERAESFYNAAGDPEHAAIARQGTERVLARSAETESTEMHQP